MMKIIFFVQLKFYFFATLTDAKLDRPKLKWHHLWCERYSSMKWCSYIHRDISILSLPAISIRPVNFFQFRSIIFFSSKFVHNHNPVKHRRLPESQSRKIKWLRMPTSWTTCSRTSGCSRRCRLTTCPRTRRLSGASADP